MARPPRSQRVLGKVMDRWCRLPAATSGYTITRDLRIPARDGVDLLADLYEPTGPAAGTILVRSPYGWSAPVAAFTGGVFARRGFRVLLARCRGTFGSGGTFDPMVHEVDDGADTVAWMREQPWFDGRFATYGASYMGFTQWALLMDPPPELVTAVVMVGPHDFRSAVYPGGAFALNDFLGWSNQTSRQEEHGAVRTLLNQLRGARALAKATHELPLVDAGERLLDGRAPWYRGLGHPARPGRSVLGSRPARRRVGPRAGAGAAPDRLAGPLPPADARAVPAPLGSRRRRRPHRRTVDAHLAHDQGRPPHPHRGAGLVRRAPRGQRSIGPAPQPVSVFVTGADQWRDLASWPPPATERVLHLQPGGGLGDEPAPSGSGTSFTYDPADPTPSIGGRLLDPRDGGYKDDRALAQRPDVATFTGSPLIAPLDVLGCSRARAGAPLRQPACRSVRAALRGEARRQLPERQRGVLPARSRLGRRRHPARARCDRAPLRGGQPDPCRDRRWLPPAMGAQPRHRWRPGDLEPDGARRSGPSTSRPRTSCCRARIVLALTD